MDKKRGRFLLSRDFIESNPDAVKELMGMCIVVRAEMLYYSNSVEYYAECDLFKPLREGFELPLYALKYDGVEWTIPLEYKENK